MLIKTNDLNAIYELDIKCFGQGAYRYSNYIINESYTHFIINENSEDIGFITLLNTMDGNELIKIGIIERRRNQGYATKALKELLEILDNKKIFLEVSQNNISAIRLYEAVGFKVINIRKAYYKDGSDALIMAINN